VWGQVFKRPKYLLWHGFQGTQVFANTESLLYEIFNWSDFQLNNYPFPLGHYPLITALYIISKM